MVNLHAQAALLWEHGAGSAWCHQTTMTAFFAGPPCRALPALTRPLTPFSRVNATHSHIFYCCLSTGNKCHSPLAQPAPADALFHVFLLLQWRDLWWSAILAVAILSRVESVRDWEGLKAPSCSEAIAFYYITSVQGTLLSAFPPQTRCFVDTQRCAMHFTTPSLLPNAASRGVPQGRRRAGGIMPRARTVVQGGSCTVCTS